MGGVRSFFAPVGPTPLGSLFYPLTPPPPEEVMFRDWDDYIRAQQFRSCADKVIKNPRRWWLGGPDPHAGKTLVFEKLPTTYGQAIEASRQEYLRGQARRASELFGDIEP